MIPAYHAGYVVDASVGVKWFAEGENHTEQAISLRDHYLGGHCRVAVPNWLFFLEIANAMGRKKGFAEESTARVLRNLWGYRFELVEPHEGLLTKTNAISRGYRASIYDSAYVAVAEATGFPLVTADAELLKRMKGHSIVLPLWELEFPPASGV
jgi:predicted nucleic acid-binding protein